MKPDPLTQPQPDAVDGHDTSTLAEHVHRAIDIGLAFKSDPTIYGRRRSPEQIRDLLLVDLQHEPEDLNAIVENFVDTVLPFCKNEASPRFMGFGDTGDDPAALVGGTLMLTTQQNLINQSFDAPSATFIEIAVIRWLRNLLGLHNPPVPHVQSVWDVGGIVTPGGTTSNASAMLLARERLAPRTMQVGVTRPDYFGVVVPRGIGHYSIKSSLAWIGLGAQTIEVATSGFRYDRKDLRRALELHRGRIMAVVAYAGDSRTQTVDNLRAVHDIVREAEPRAWLHADACWGLICALSGRQRHRLDGIELFDSVTVDPHKVMAVPHGMSALLVREPGDLRLVASHSDLIMQEEFAFGQATPFLGTKGWISLKLWMMMRFHGRRGLADIADRRVERARAFALLLDEHPRMLRLHDPELAAVAFIRLPRSLCGKSRTPSVHDVEQTNELNRQIHARVLENGLWHLHQFSLPDDLGKFSIRSELSALRFMSNNEKITEMHMREILDYVDGLGTQIEESCDEQE